MADTVDITAGTGTKVSTEEVTTLNGGAVAAQHLQRTATAVRTADGVAHDLATGAGAVTAATARFTLASDDLAVLALQQAVTSLPHFALDATTDLSHDNKSRTGVGETSMVTATASQTTRLHEYVVTVPGAGTVEIRDGASGTALLKHVFNAADGIGRELNPRPWAVTTANTALVFYWSGSGEANIDFYYKKSA